jgi:hypothetical protein
LTLPKQSQASATTTTTARKSRGFIIPPLPPPFFFPSHTGIPTLAPTTMTKIAEGQALRLDQITFKV